MIFIQILLLIISYEIKTLLLTFILRRQKLKKVEINVCQKVEFDLMTVNLVSIWPIECPPRLDSHYKFYMGVDLNRFREILTGDKTFQITKNL